MSGCFWTRTAKGALFAFCTTAFFFYTPIVQATVLREVLGEKLERRAQAHINWLLFTVCEGTLYTHAGAPVSWPALERPFLLELNYARDISTDQLEELSEEVLRRNHNAPTLEALQSQIQLFYDALVPIAEGDRYALLFQPNKGTTLLFNGEPQVMIPGEDFARVYFSIYLGDQPVHEGFRDRLLATQQD